MKPYQPLYIKGMEQGLIQDREEFILPSDAYPILENAFVWRERIKRKQGYQLLGRLRRTFTTPQSLGMSGASPWSFNLFATVSPAITETNAEIEAGSVVITIGAITFTDQGNGTLTSVTPGNSGTINYNTSQIVITYTGGAAAATAVFNYFPTLPVMGIRYRDLSTQNIEMTIFFDTVYAYNFQNGGFQEFIPGFTWSGTDSEFFWTTNYWVTPGTAGVKLFWATNFSGTSGDPIRYTNGTGNASGTWIDFAPTINAAGDKLNQCLCMLPFRGRLLAFNTLEGPNLAGSTSFFNRIRWSQIGNPISDISTLFPLAGDVSPNAWRDDIPGKGGFLDIPTNEDIITVGFVRDNLVIYCEQSTWQLRYTGRSISPFQIEKVNTELGASGTFSAVQFDTSLVGVGDKGIVECDSFQSQRIDIKIPDLVMNHINNKNFGDKRVHGIRDFLQRLAYWTYPESDNNGTYPDRRLVYNYENGSWAIFTDSLTTLGTFQPTISRTWANPTGGNASVKLKWEEANFSWGNKPSLILSIVGGNQQGYIEYLDEQTTNDESLTITAITGNTTTPTQITSPNHNMQTGAVVKILDIPTGTPFATSLNNNIFGVIVNSANTFLLMKYNATTQMFSDPQLDAPASYVGGGQIAIRDNFRIVSKKFNFLDEGQNIQVGYIDILMNTSDNGAISLNVYVDYNDNAPSNNLPNNRVPATGLPDTFFNITIPTSASSFSSANSTKLNQRVFCPTRGNYITLEYTFSNAQMNSIEQENDVQIDMQVLWARPAGRIGSI